MNKPTHSNGLDNLSVPKSELDRMKRINYEQGWLIHDLRIELHKKEEVIAKLQKEIEERNKILDGLAARGLYVITGLAGVVDVLTKEEVKENEQRM